VGEEWILDFLDGRAEGFDLLGLFGATSLLGVFFVVADRCFLADGISTLSSDLRFC
jgi:hypothetical protein